jgi:uncharacterized protein YlxW (UPF0749 family)
VSPSEPGLPEHHPHRASWHQRLRTALTAAGRSRSRPVWWRLLAPATFILAGALFVASANTAGGTDIRGGRITDLAGLAQAEADQLEELRNEQARLAAEVESLSDQLTGSSSEVVERARGLREPAGLAPVRGPGLTVTLTDAPEAVIESAETDINNLLVVHQQDIQAVVNALWAGGAEAMTVQGQRVVSTTGIRCVGNTVVLHDVPYAPPYVISAIGPTDQMLAAIDESPYVDFYLDYVENYQLGWDLQLEDDLRMPGYVGSTALDHARPVTDASGTDDAI